MGIQFAKGDIFKADVQVIVNPVNCVGVMGAGLALPFKKKFPEMFESYKKVCAQKLLHPGMLHHWKHSTPEVLNFPTKDHFRSASKIEYITDGLKKFVETYQQRGITSIAFPKLGCGKGGLEWSDVKQEIISHLGELDDVEIYIYE